MNGLRNNSVYELNQELRNLSSVFTASYEEFPSRTRDNSKLAASKGFEKLMADANEGNSSSATTSAPLDGDNPPETTATTPIAFDRQTVPVVRKDLDNFGSCTISPSYSSFEQSGLWELMKHRR
jgi:hypothetical protein